MKNKISLSLLVVATLLLAGCYPVSTFQGNTIVMTEADGGCGRMPTMTIFAHMRCQEAFGRSSAVFLKSQEVGTCPDNKAIKMVFECQNLKGGGTGASASDTSRLELRAMQTRKFLKSPTVVVKAITELNKDKGSKCVGLSVPKYTCQGTMQDVVVGDKTVKKCMAADGVSSGLVKMQSSVAECTNSTGMNASYEIDSNFPANNQTIVRIRLSNSSNPQIADPTVYSRIFKEIADGLFIDAIQLTPAEMQ
ncbi:hypothetical protein [Polynucleobacter sp. AP-Kaivos-20-H2]|uniref:hypothetical protein n=1 Tax=Polynucleobacter sp. AP-Kaivos-20-H2 TaxID=2689104 RepID=UPI001C0B1B85|nr:hypothetical protein [Polynucleobacter sp. AP-Kaivos-20-H2]MBU3603471.1 hypothetical protein [Polynucleobacter sp. AP-Kaivos-20-H2]